MKYLQIGACSYSSERGILMKAFDITLDVCRASVTRNIVALVTLPAETDSDWNGGGDDVW